MPATVVWALSAGGQSGDVFKWVVDRVTQALARLICLFIIDPKVADVVFSKVASTGFLGGKPSANLHAAILREYEARAHRKLEHVEVAAREAGLRIEGLLRHGEFAAVCAQVVKEKQVSQLLLGELSRYSFYQFLKGQATVQELERNAGCPVEIFKKD